MPTRMPARTQTPKRSTGARFSRTSGTSPGRTAGGRRAAAPSRRTTLTPRRKPQPTGRDKAMKAIGSMLGGGAAKKASGSGKGKTAGLAMLAGAAGLAMKNRDRIGSMIGRKGSSASPLEGSMPDSPPKVIPHADPADPAGNSTIADTDRPAI